MTADRFLLKHSSRRRDERGVTLVIVAMFMVALLIVAALVIDVGRMRSRGQSMQSAADLSALAAEPAMRNADISTACQDAVNYFRTNVPAVTSISASGLCSQAGNDINTTTCTGGTLAEATPSATAGGITISIHYPVPDSEITSNGIVGARVNDGDPCQRLRVVVTDSQTGFFSGLAGRSSLSATRSATIRVKPGQAIKAPALWLLDPTGCVSLGVTGGSHVTVGTAAVGGLITVDSDGSTCQSSQYTISTGGSGSQIIALGNTADPGMITLDALRRGATVCSAPACNPSDVSSGFITPQPIAAGRRATRAPVDWQFNCKSTYPNYHGFFVAGCASGAPAYMDLLKAAVGTTVGVKPDSTYQQFSKIPGMNCNVASGTFTITGNVWVDCTGANGLKIGNGTNLTFSGGNVVMDGPLNMTGGSIKFNTANGTPVLPTACTPPTVTTPCIDNSSGNAAFVFSRAGAWSLTGSAALQAEGVSVILNGSGAYVKMSASPPVWHAPTEGPFAGLAYWGEASSNQNQVNGGSGASLSGIFFAPEAAPFSLAGNSDWGQQAAQFISYQLAVSGGGNIAISPNAQAVKIVPPITALIR